MTDVISACKSDSLIRVEKALSAPKNINDEFLDKNGNKFTPLTWACSKGMFSLIEMMVKKNANPNILFTQSDGKEISIIDWVITQGNAALVDVLLKHGATITPYTFQIAQSKADKLLIYTISDKTKETVRKMYKSHNYMAFENKLIDFSIDNLYIFAFNVGKANFIAARRYNKVVIVDAGNDSGEAIRNFKESNKNYNDIIKSLDILIECIEDFCKGKSRVRKMFNPKSDTEPKKQYKAVLKKLKKIRMQEQIDLFSSLLDMDKYQKIEILEIIEKIKRKYIELEKYHQRKDLNLVFRNTEVEKVFITHPDLDHFSFLIDMLDNFANSFNNTKYLFGGIKNDWKRKNSQELLKKISEDQIEFLGYNYDSKQYNCLDGLDVKVWGQDGKAKNKNEISFFTTIDFNGRGVMFTGDANGDNLERLKFDKREIVPYKETIEFFDEIEAIIKNNRKCMKDSTVEVSQKLEEFRKKNNCDSKIEETVNKMLALEKTVLIFEPHHGSLEGNSHDIYKYFSAQRQKKVFCISSYPKPSYYIPKKESFDNRVKEPKVKEHPIVYAAFNNIPTMNVTTDPVYTTGACCDGMYVFSISNDGNLSVLDLTEEIPQFEKINI